MSGFFDKPARLREGLPSPFFRLIFAGQTPRAASRQITPRKPFEQSQARSLALTRTLASKA
jgi:hypothetical protein